MYGGMVDGTKSTNYRTTFALDETTARRLNRLSSAWHVSRAEVVRRAVAMADASAECSVNPGELLQKLHTSGGGLVRESAETYLAEIRTARTDWRRET